MRYRDAVLKITNDLVKQKKKDLQKEIFRLRNAVEELKKMTKKRKERLYYPFSKDENNPEVFRTRPGRDYFDALHAAEYLSKVLKKEILFEFNGLIRNHVGEVMRTFSDKSGKIEYVGILGGTGLI